MTIARDSPDRSVWTGRPDKSAWIGQPGQDREEGYLGYDSKVRTGELWTRVLKQESWDRTAGTGQQGDRIAGTGQLGQDRLYRTFGTEQKGRGQWKAKIGGKRKWSDNTARTGKRGLHA
jgi:hypothetical protein